MRLTEVNNKVFFFLHGILQETQKCVSVNLVCKEQQRKNYRFFLKANLHCKLRRSVLALKIGPFQWVKYSPIFDSYDVAPLIRGQYGPIT